MGHHRHQCRGIFWDSWHSGAAVVWDLGVTSVAGATGVGYMSGAG